MGEREIYFFYDGRKGYRIGETNATGKSITGSQNETIKYIISESAVIKPIFGDKNKGTKFSKESRETIKWVIEQHNQLRNLESKIRTFG